MNKKRNIIETIYIKERLKGYKMKLVAVPFDIIQVNNGIMLKRGCIEVRIAGERAVQAMQTILDAVGGTASAATKEEVCNLFAAPDRPSIAHLIDELVKRRLLIAVENDAPKIEIPETKLDIFYWHFGDQPGKVTKQLNSIRLVILGVNNISRQLVYSLNRSGVKNFEIVDYPLLRSTENYESDYGRIGWPELSEHSPLDFKTWEDRPNPESMDCLIATSDLGAMQFMRKWNDFCVRNNRSFLPIVLRDLIGYVGPLVIPHKTACYECYLLRRRANMEESEIVNSRENIAPDGNKVVGYHPAMASILGDIAVMELVKFYGISAPIFNVGKLIRLNMLSTQLQTHRVLKVPRCKVCSTMNKRSSTSISNLLYKI